MTNPKTDLIDERNHCDKRFTSMSKESIQKIDRQSHIKTLAIGEQTLRKLSY